MKNCTIVLLAAGKKYVEKLNSYKVPNYFREFPVIIAVNTGDDKLVCAKSWGDNVTVVNTGFGTERLDYYKLMKLYLTLPVMHVRTRYWMKLDIDTNPKPIMYSKEFSFPEEFFTHTLTAHKWGYTKIKRDHLFDADHVSWVTRLDNFADSLSDFDGTVSPFNGCTMQGERKIIHRRVATFCAIEKVSWTKHLYDMCSRWSLAGQKNQLLGIPVPSQDTLTWYCLARLGNGRTINAVDMKRYITV